MNNIIADKEKIRESIKKIAKEKASTFEEAIINLIYKKEDCNLCESDVHNLTKNKIISWEDVFKEFLSIYGILDYNYTTFLKSIFFDTELDFVLDLHLYAHDRDSERNLIMFLHNVENMFISEIIAELKNKIFLSEFDLELNIDSIKVYKKEQNVCFVF